MSDKTSKADTDETAPDGPELPDAETKSETPARRFWVLPKAGALKATREYLVNLSFFGVLLVVGVVSYETIIDKTIRINPIEVPSDLVGNGFTRELVSKRIADEIRRIQTRANTIKEASKLATDLEEIEIKIPGAEVSVLSVIDEIGTFIGFEKREISGEITKTEAGYAIRLRMPVNGDVFDLEADAATNEAVNGLIRSAARRILKATDPFMISAYYFGEREYGKARQYIRHTLERGSRLEKAWALNLLGVIETDDFNPATSKQERIAIGQRALGHLGRAVELQPDFALPYLTRADIHQYIGKFNDAEDDYKEASRLSPGLPNLHLNWGSLFARSGNFVDAIKKLKEGWILRPQDNLIGHKLVEYYFYNDNYRDSLEVLKTLKEMDPTDAVTRHLLAAAYEKLGDDALQRSEKAAAIYLDPNGEKLPEALK